MKGVGFVAIFNSYNCDCPALVRVRAGGVRARVWRSPASCYTTRMSAGLTLSWDCLRPAAGGSRVGVEVPPQVEWECEAIFKFCHCELLHGAWQSAFNPLSTQTHNTHQIAPHPPQAVPLPHRGRLSIPLLGEAKSSRRLDPRSGGEVWAKSSLSLSLSYGEGPRSGGEVDGCTPKYLSIFSTVEVLTDPAPQPSSHASKAKSSLSLSLSYGEGPRSGGEVDGCTPIYPTMFSTVEVLTDPAPQPSTTRTHTPTPLPREGKTAFSLENPWQARAGGDHGVVVEDPRSEAKGKEVCAQIFHYPTQVTACVPPSGGLLTSRQRWEHYPHKGGLLKRRHRIVNFINIYLVRPGAPCRYQQSTLKNHLEESNAKKFD